MVTTESSTGRPVDQGTRPIAIERGSPPPAAVGRAPGNWNQLAERIVAEYREMPELSLTAAQAARLWSVDGNACVAVLQALVAQGKLRCTRERRYCIAGDLERVWRSPR